MAEWPLSGARGSLISGTRGPAAIRAGEIRWSAWKEKRCPICRRPLPRTGWPLRGAAGRRRLLSDIPVSESGNDPGGQQHPDGGRFDARAGAVSTAAGVGPREHFDHDPLFSPDKSLMRGVMPCHRTRREGAHLVPGRKKRPSADPQHQSRRLWSLCSRPALKFTSINLP